MRQRPSTCLIINCGPKRSKMCVKKEKRFNKRLKDRNTLTILAINNYIGGNPMKGNTINVRLTDEERSKLETSAANLNMSLSQYVRTLVNDHPYCPIDKSKKVIISI